MRAARGRARLWTPVPTLQTPPQLPAPDTASHQPALRLVCQRKLSKRPHCLAAAPTWFSTPLRSTPAPLALPASAADSSCSSPAVVATRGSTSTRVKERDLLFVLRKDRKRLDRVLSLLEVYEEQKEARGKPPEDFSKDDE